MTTIKIFGRNKIGDRGKYEGEIIQTAKAGLFELSLSPDGTSCWEEWIPKAALVRPFVDNGDFQELPIADWFAKKIQPAGA